MTDRTSVPKRRGTSSSLWSAGAHVQGAVVASDVETWTDARAATLGLKDGDNPLVAPLARWGARAGATAVDLTLTALVIGFLAPVGHGASLIGVVFAWIGLPAFQGYTGWTPGKAAMGLRLTSVRSWLAGDFDPEPVGIVRSILRNVAHLVDAVTVIGFLWPVVDRRRRQTFADKIVSTVVVRIRGSQ